MWVTFRSGNYLSVDSVNLRTVKQIETIEKDIWGNQFQVVIKDNKNKVKKFPFSAMTGASLGFYWVRSREELENFFKEVFPFGTSFQETEDGVWKNKHPRKMKSKRESSLAPEYSGQDMEIYGGSYKPVFTLPDTVKLLSQQDFCCIVDDGELRYMVDNGTGFKFLNSDDIVTLSKEEKSFLDESSLVTTRYKRYKRNLNKEVPVSNVPVGDVYV